MAEKNHFGTELTSEELLELVEKSTPDATKKATQSGMKLFDSKLKYVWINLQLQL